MWQFEIGQNSITDIISATHDRWKRLFFITDPLILCVFVTLYSLITFVHSFFVNLVQKHLQNIRYNLNKISVNTVELF